MTKVLNDVNLYEEIVQIYKTTSFNGRLGNPVSSMLKTPVSEKTRGILLGFTEEAKTRIKLETRP